MTTETDTAGRSSSAAAPGPETITAVTNVDAHVRAMLVKGERVLCRAIIHPAIYWKSVAVLIAAALVSFIAVPLGVVLMIPGIIMLCLAILYKHYLMLVLTNKRILARAGILMVEVVNINLKQVESLELERMIPGQIFGYSNVLVTGTGQRAIRIPFIANGIEFRHAFDELVYGEEEEAEQKERPPAEDE